MNYIHSPFTKGREADEEGDVLGCFRCFAFCVLFVAGAAASAFFFN